MASPRKACRCCGRTLDAAGESPRKGVCIGCAATRREGRAKRPASTGVPVPGGAGTPPAGFPQWHSLPEPGEDLNGLVVERRLGEGGMGLVLTARDPGLDRLVAVKFLRTGFVGDPRAQRFFRREGRALAGINHPHVVRVYSVGEWRGWPYLVMELVEGVTLATRMGKGELPLPEVLRIAEELASALAAAHAVRIAHRDVNPSNVVLRTGDGSACLIDFGLAKAMDRATETSGAVAGTPLYMAPEQIARQRHDHRVDVYSFGATLYEMVTGRVPHETPGSAAFFRAVLNDDVPLLRAVRPEAPRPLEVLVARALARAPELRQRDGAALLEEIRAVRRGLAGGGEAAAADRVAEGAAAAAERTEEPAAVPAGDPSEALPLLGRNDEYAAAVKVLDGIAGWSGQLLLVEGEAGAGKSRLLRELERAARARAFGVVRCAGAEFSGNPFRALRSGLLEYSRGLGASTPEEAAALATKAFPGNRPLVPALRWLLDPGHGEAEVRPGRSDLARAFLALLRAFLALRPVLLVAEDVHQLDAGSLELLVAATEQGTAWPLGVALSYRPPGGMEPRSPLTGYLPRLRGAPRAVIITLGPLPEAAVAAMIHRTLRVDEAEACRLAPLLHRKSSGNPLYVVEALRLLEQEKVVGVQDGQRRVRQRLTSLAIPPRLLELAVRRVAGLPAMERDALGVASTDPAGVTSGLVARCLDCSRLRALRALQHLVSSRGLLGQEGDRYWISHGEIRDAAYGELIPELRAAYHLEAAHALREAGAGKAEPERLGRHLQRAGLAAEAAPHLLEAGRVLLHGHSPAEALEFFEEALECAGAAGLPAAAVGRAQAQELMGELDAARGTLDALVAAGGEGAGEALLPLAEFERNRGHHRAALEILEKAEGLPLPTDRRLRLLLLEAQAHSQLGQGDAALGALERAEALAGAASKVRLLELWNTKGTVRWRLDRFEEARDCFERAVPIAEEIGALERTASLLYNIGLVSSDLGRGDEALAWVEKAIERALLAGNHRTLVHARLLRAELLLEAMRLDDAERALDEAAEGLEGLGSSDARCQYCSCRAELESARGRFDPAIEWAVRGLAQLGDNRKKRAEFRVLRAQALLDAGRMQEGLEEARLAMADASGAGTGRLAGDALACAARALRELGREGEERSALAGLPSTSSLHAAVERALESRGAAERARWEATARALARSEQERAVIARRLGGR